MPWVIPGIDSNEVICQKSAVSGQRSAVSGQQSAVSGQQSAVSGQLFGIGFDTNVIHKLNAIACA
ncbi:MAG: hypothetical protein F6K37_42505 [Moorea sp. SIO4E2]|uniref:hypothetical protein n=1 Tax=Moorena sp. SIO4E2 TaxID=2607826 RepID=UPI0013B64522|nr:hypothetical protein [Moorena sp. SIO4E2]NEQ12272.1 hypothetical protein [Moorena sp. SIO4E2]